MPAFGNASTASSTHHRDTVSAVGIYPRNDKHPYTSVNYATKYFRHALALDERRIRFRPQTWHETTTEREQELDVDEPVFPASDEGDYTPPSRNIADVKEVWFSGVSNSCLRYNHRLHFFPGAHADIGGGSHHNRLRNSLSYIPLRWMIREVEEAKCGILFDAERKEDYMRETLSTSDSPPAHEAGSALVANGHSVQSRTVPQYAADVFALLYDQLVINWWFWWLLEVLPLLTTIQTMDGDWVRQKVYVTAMHSSF